MGRTVKVRIWFYRHGRLYMIGMSCGADRHGQDCQGKELVLWACTVESELKITTFVPMVFA